MWDLSHGGVASTKELSSDQLRGRDVLSLEEFSLEEIILILETAEHFEEMVASQGRLSLLFHRILATLFYEPSTRTRLSFETAMQRLGGGVISVADAKSSSSVVKGESLTDTVRIISGYADVIVLRHPEEGTARLAAEAASVPVINAGDGAGHHPTQALLDLYTLRKECGHIEGLHVALVGDLRYGRTVHSLAKILGRFGVRLTFVSPSDLAMPRGITHSLKEEGTHIEETSDLEEAAREADVLYITRMQKERFPTLEEYDRCKGCYRVDLSLISRAREGITIMHPLPRVNEISPEVDEYPGAAYFRQAANGIPVRMALLALILGEE